MFGFTRRRRERLLAEPFPDAWEEAIARNMRYWGLLNEDERAEIREIVQVLLGEKSFEGAGGLEMTDAIRATIAAQAGVLLLGREHDYFPKLSSIVVYPKSYVAPVGDSQQFGVVQQSAQARLGESWARGTVVLAWSSVVEGGLNPNDARNVVFHEFAHQLDAEQPHSSGAPDLPERAMYPRWAEAFGEAYRELLEALEEQRRTVLDEYAATNAAEFFAVVTETFFERPNALMRAHPEVYVLLAEFYRQDPAQRTTR